MISASYTQNAAFSGASERLISPMTVEHRVVGQINSLGFSIGEDVPLDYKIKIWLVAQLGMEVFSLQDLFFEPVGNKQGAAMGAILQAGKCADPVILLEGTRNLSNEDRLEVVWFTERLARMLPRAKFRTGNATGTVEAFAQGVKNVDPWRLEFVVPCGTLRKSKVPPESAVFSLEDIYGNVRAEICRQTKEASPRIAPPIDLFRKVGRKNRHTVKALYLLRDTLKVIGSKSQSLALATAGIFYVDMENPFTSGTGHTISLCSQNNVPVLD
ncbi:MAG: hypothetical protein JRF59_16825 [Deltaproteobacteria bacterium]|nr:hypothetical protein [Deltaproteobacteria bacterium]